MSAQRLLINTDGNPYMPRKIKEVLMRHGIKQKAWCDAIMQTNGKALSLAAGTQILNWNTWPKNTSQESIKQQTEEFLIGKGAKKTELANIWEFDQDDPMRNGHPTGVHVGQEFRKTDHVNLIGEIEMLSQQAKKHFGIFMNPFIGEMKSKDDVFITPDITYVSQSMMMNAKHGGILAVIGESGSGKSTIRIDFLERVAKDSEPIRVIFPRVLDKEKLSAGMLCEAIINDMDPYVVIPQTLERKGRLVEKLLRESYEAGVRHVLIIEESQDLDIHILKILKRIYEIQDGYKKLISIILIGQPELAVKLDETRHPKAREFIRRCEKATLEPLDNHLPAYLKFKFERQNVDAERVFSEDAYDAIRARLTLNDKGELISHVHPLSVNNLVTKAMNLAADIGEQQITAALIAKL